MNQSDSSAKKAGNSVLTIDTAHPQEPLGDLFGIFFEDINHAADGGLYAEMVQRTAPLSSTRSTIRSIIPSMPGKRWRKEGRFGFRSKRSSHTMKTALTTW